MTVFDTPGGRRGFQQGVTSGNRDEVIQRRWLFKSGIETKGLKVFGEGAVAGQPLVASDSDGNLTFSGTLPSTTFTDTAETASQTSTIVATAVGEYLVTVYAQCTTAGAAGTLDVDISYTDDIGATSIRVVTALTLAAQGRAQGVIVIRCSGGGIDFTATVTGPVGGPQYALHISVNQVR